MRGCSASQLIDIQGSRGIAVSYTKLERRNRISSPVSRLNNGLSAASSSAFGDAYTMGSPLFDIVDAASDTAEFRPLYCAPSTNDLRTG